MEEAGSECLRFRAKVDVVESMGSELYVYFEVQHEGVDSSRARRSSRRTRAWRTCRRTAPAASRSSPASRRSRRPRRGSEVELGLDTSKLKLFDPDGGRNLTA